MLTVDLEITEWHPSAGTSSPSSTSGTRLSPPESSGEERTTSLASVGGKFHPDETVMPCLECILPGC